MESVFSKELDYKKLNYVYPSYRMNRIYSQSGSTTQTITSSGGMENIWDIPSSLPVNLSKSYISFQAKIPETTTGGNAYNFIYRDTISWWRQFQLTTAGGVQLIKLDDLANYCKVIFKAELGLLEFVAFDTDIAGATTTSVYGASHMIQRSNALSDAKDRPTGAYAGADTVLTTTSSIPYTECRYLTTSAIANGASAGDLNLNVIIDLNLLKNTLASVNKDIYAGEILKLKVVWNPTSKIYFSATSNDGKYTGGASGANNITVTNMALYLCTEINPEIVRSMKEKVQNGGIQMLIPYVTSNRQPLVGNSVAVSNKYTRQHGVNLVKLYYSAFNADESVNKAYDNNNVIGTVGPSLAAAVAGTSPTITSYYTQLNGQRLQDFTMECNKWDDYKLLQPKLKGSITQNSNIYNYSHFFVDDFSGNDSLLKEVNDNLNYGLSLDTDQIYEVYVNLPTAMANTAMSHFVFCVTQKLLTINSTGITCL